MNTHTHLVLLSMFLFLRLTEQIRLKTDLERIMGALRERYRETQQWQKRHKVSGGGRVRNKVGCRALEGGAWSELPAFSCSAHSWYKCIDGLSVALLLLSSPPLCQHAFEVMQGNVFQEISAKLRRPIEIGQAGYEVAAAFLHSAGQGHTVDTVSASLPSDQGCPAPQTCYIHLTV